jgi:hypothetical protein
VGRPEDHAHRAPAVDLFCEDVGAHEKDPGRAAPDAGPLRVARLCALPIGVLAWRAPEPTLTVIVKATFSLHEDGTATLADEQEPLAIDRPAAGGSFGDLDRACDFVPLKARVDVLLTGHARSEAAMHVLPAGFAVDKLRRRFYATTEEPSAETPLLPEHLRSGTGDATRVGARAMWAGTLDGAAIVGDDGVPCAPIPRGFDYTAFNVAPPEQQMEMLSLTAQIVLDGLTPGGRRTARLPGIRPRVFAIAEGESWASRTPDEVVLRCDTIWIDADRCLAMLTWRGVIPGAAGAHVAPSLVLALDEGDRKKTWARALRELDGAAWTTTTGPADASSALEDEGPSTDRMAEEAASRLADAEAALAPEDDEDDDTRAHRRLSPPGIGAILIEEEPSTHRRGSIAAASATPVRPPLLVLGGLGGTLASFEARSPPQRPQRPQDLHFGRREDFTGAAIGIRASPEEATSLLSFEAPATDAIVQPEVTSVVAASGAPAGAAPNDEDDDGGGDTTAWTRPETAPIKAKRAPNRKG